MKNRTEIPVEKLRPNKVPEKLWQHISVDFIIKLLVSKGHDSILVVCNKLFTAYHLQTDNQTERTNQKLEQYLRMYVNYRQNNWSEWLATAEFVFNNKVHTVTKMSLFKVNYGRELRMGFNIRKKRKNKKAEEFVREIKEKHEKARVALVKLQEEMKKQVDRNRKEAEEYRVEDKVLISTKSLDHM